jgi:pyruvate formate lyase activating enzyme
MEKKPFLHVLPGTRVLSVATAGCNFHCKFCQNWEISQAFPEDVFCYDVPPKALAKRAKGMGARSIAYTYVEPTVFYEYMYDACRSAKASGLLNMIHSNGFINPEPLQRLCKFLDAAQIDLKGFTEDFYDDLCVGKLEPVLGTLKVLKQNNVHLEITNLVIPTKNDSMAIIRSMCRWIITHLGPETPLHFSRFYPLYRLRKLPPTPIALLQEAHETARSCGLKYVYIGNVPGHSAWNTSCPGCSRIIIHRIGYVIRETHMDKGNCAFCGYPIPGIWT